MYNNQLKIKQMMPIPDGFEAMTVIVQEDGTEQFEATAGTLFPHCLVLLKDDIHGDRIELYELGPFGTGVADDMKSILVPMKHCPKCGKRLVPHTHGLDESTLYYLCDCGYNSETAEDGGQ